MSWCTAALTLLLATASGAAEPAADPFAGLRFLVGEWPMARGGGAPGEATSGSFTFAPDLAGRVLVRRSTSTYPPAKGQKEPQTHDDLMVVYVEQGQLRADYFDSEGHVIRYGVTTGPNTATFESEPGAGPVRFKLVYEQKAPGSVAVTFSIAQPGQPYKPYVSGSASRK